MPIQPGQQTGFMFENPAEVASAALDQLQRWEPDTWPVADDWQPVVSKFLKSAAAVRLGHFVETRLTAGAAIYPPKPFRALALTPLANVRVVILGQDPYHGAGQAQGLAFSVAPGVAIPPSLRNIFKEIARDEVAHAFRPSLGRYLAPADGSLERWAEQGVLMLNTCLTVESGQPASHAKQGWEVLTDEIIRTVGLSAKPIVFMLWGAHAQAKKSLLPDADSSWSSSDQRPASSSRRLVLTANHPSPLSALRPPQPFIGCGHFGRANAFLQEVNQSPVDW